MVLSLAEKEAIWFKLLVKTRTKPYGKLYVCIISCFLFYAEWLFSSEDICIQSEDYCSISYDFLEKSPFVAISSELVVKARNKV